jgi:tetratricopeptide (TPR) repeat protein
LAHETSKQAARRWSDRRFATRWLTGCGIDIGCGKDSLGELAPFFPLMASVIPWDLPDGDAMLMAGVADASFDFVHSSHCLEHLADPVVALRNWIRICRPGGHIVVTIPDEDLYEQGIWPSAFNADHKWTFTIAKTASWSPRSVSLFDLLGRFLDEIEVLKIELLDSGYRYQQPRHDQSLGMLSESAIEFILRKKSNAPQASGASCAENVSATFARAVTCHQEGRRADAAALYRVILATTPDHVAALNNLALIVDAQEAESLLKNALQRNPDYLDALTNLAAIYINKQDYVAAEVCLRRIVGLSRNHAQAFHQLGTVVESQGKYEEAMAAFETAVELGQSPADCYFRMGRICEILCKYDDSIRYLEQALAIEPNHAECHVLRGHAHLRAGQFREGAECLTWIWKHIGLEDQRFLFVDEAARPRRLDGKTVVLCADSGLGDTLQFVRYATLLKAQGADVVIECQKELVRLLETMDAVRQVVPIGDALPPFDHRVPLHNLIGAFATTLESVPASVPYLSASPAQVGRWRERLRAVSGLKVGVVWSGNPKHIADARRSMPEALLRPLAAVPGVALVSLQMNSGRHDFDLLDWTGELADMADTAALVESLDLVISIDTAVAHLAGAMGRPVWLLNRFDACWRWLVDRTDSPWYPTMRLFRQRAQGDWAGVIADVGAALSKLPR